MSWDHPDPRRRRGAGLPAVAANAASAVARVVAAVATGQPVAVAEAEQNRRLAVCHGCDQFDGTRCKVCGCFANLKTHLATERCPAGKW